MMSHLLWEAEYCQIPPTILLCLKAHHQKEYLGIFWCFKAVVSHEYLQVFQMSKIESACCAQPRTGQYWAFLVTFLEGEIWIEFGAYIDMESIPGANCRKFVISEETFHFFNSLCFSFWHFDGRVVMFCYHHSAYMWSLLRTPIHQTTPRLLLRLHHTQVDTLSALEFRLVRSSSIFSLPIIIFSSVLENVRSNSSQSLILVWSTKSEV